MTNKPMLSVERDSIALEALKVARQFIANGIELGYIRMPEPETPDSAHGTLPMIDRAIVELRAILDKPVAERKPFAWYRVPKDFPLQGAFFPYTEGQSERDIQNSLEAEFGFNVKRLYDEPAAQHQGEPVARHPDAIIEGVMTSVGITHAIYASTVSLKHGEQVKLYSEQPAPVAVELPERSSQDYAIEHAEYMAKSADGVLAKFQAYGLALLAVDEGGDDGEGELFEAIDSARGDLQEALVDLRSMVYEFRKRSAKSR